MYSFLYSWVYVFIDLVKGSAFLKKMNMFSSPETILSPYFLFAGVVSMALCFILKFLLISLFELIMCLQKVQKSTKVRNEPLCCSWILLLRSNHWHQFLLSTIQKWSMYKRNIFFHTAVTKIQSCFSSPNSIYLRECFSYQCMEDFLIFMKNDCIKSSWTVYLTKGKMLK